MPALHPEGFREGVVAIVRPGEGPIAQIAWDFRISLSARLAAKGDVDDGVEPVVMSVENAENRELK